MTQKIATSLNKSGQQHVADELKRLGLEWDLDATCSEIEEKSSFMSLEYGFDDAMYYDTVKGQIEILADEHVNFEEIE